MELKAALNKLKKNPEFKEWKKNKKNNYFSYAFKIVEKNKQTDWQIGYYDPKTDKITTFIVEKADIKITPEEDIFKKESMKVNEINLKNVKLSLKQILDCCEKFKKKSYPKEDAIKKIAILQNLEEFGDIWNITYINQNFNTLNMKLKSNNGKIIEHKLTNLFDFKQK